MAVNELSGGSFQDSEGNRIAGGTLVLTLNRDSYTDDTYSTLVCAGQSFEYTLDDNGNVDAVFSEPPVGAWANDALIDVWTLATDTYYMAKVYTSEGQLAWGPNVLYVLSSPSPFVLTFVPPSNPA